MIAICAGLLRSGSVAMWQIMREIVVSHGVGKAPALGTNFPHYTDKWAKANQIYVTKLHRYHENIGTYPETGQAIAVVTIRDIRDVVVSLHYFRGDPDWETTFNTRGYKNYVLEYNRWIDNFPEDALIVIKYEDFIADRVGVTEKVADFMGVELTEEQAKAIERKWNIEANIKRAEDNNDYNSPDYMARRHIRSGESRQWESELSPDLISRVESDHGEWLVKNGYSIIGDQAD